VNVEIPEIDMGTIKVLVVGSAAPDRGRPKVYEDTVDEAGTENTHDVNEDLGRDGGDGYIVNDGPGLLLVRISDDGVNYMGGESTGSTDEATMKVDEIMDLGGMTIDSIKIDADTDDTAYRILVI